MTDAPAPAPFDPVAHGWKQFRWHEDGFPTLVGPFWSKKEGDGWAYGLLAEPRHGNAHGIIHGGMLVTFLDQILGANGTAMLRDLVIARVMAPESKRASAAEPGQAKAQ